jgi:hypothetical protein
VQVRARLRPLVTSSAAPSEEVRGEGPAEISEALHRRAANAEEEEARREAVERSRREARQQRAERRTKAAAAAAATGSSQSTAQPNDFWGNMFGGVRGTPSSQRPGQNRQSPHAPQSPLDEVGDALRGAGEAIANATGAWMDASAQAFEGIFGDAGDPRARQRSSASRPSAPNY